MNTNTPYKNFATDFGEIDIQCLILKFGQLQVNKESPKENQLNEDELDDLYDFISFHLLHCISTYLHSQGEQKKIKYIQLSHELEVIRDNLMETIIANELLSHEQNGLNIGIFEQPLKHYRNNYDFAILGSMENYQHIILEKIKQ